MRLRLNLSVQDLAYRFGVHVFTLSRVFQAWTQIMFTCMAFQVKLSERERKDLEMTLPACFGEKFSSFAIIIDCFGVFIGRPSCLLARAQTRSSCKHHPKEQCHLFQRVGEDVHLLSSLLNTVDC